MPDSPLGREYQAMIDGLNNLHGWCLTSKAFGPACHDFQLNPPLTEAEVSSFESAHGVRLPDDYRGFLIYVGNGGTGPYYGLFKLGETDDGYEHAAWREGDGFVGALAAPFPHVQAWNDLAGKPAFDEVRAAEQTNGEYDDAYGAQLSEWEEKLYWSSDQVNGAIPICHLGCALRQWLVITGPEAGNIWCDSRADKKGIFPLENRTERRITFLRWYRAWMDEALKNVD